MVAKSPLSTAARLGAAPIEDSALPKIKTNGRVTDLIRAVVDNLPKNVIYRYNSRYVTVTEVKDKQVDGSVLKRLDVQEMTPSRFVSWVEQFMFFAKNEDGDHVESIGKTVAENILASDYLRAAVPVITNMAPIRLPAWDARKKGTRKIRILPKGYDPSTGIYSGETVKWDPTKAYDPLQVRNIIINRISGFPWQEMEQGKAWTEVRSMSVFFAYMLGQFCRHLVDKQPMVIVNGNQPGTGKTTLAKFGLAPVHGYPSVSPCPSSDDALDKMLFSSCLYGDAFTVLDDIPTLRSKAINRFVTSPKVKDRVLGRSEIMEIPNKMQLIGTGNGLETTPDIARRAIFIDLFDVCESVGKKIENPVKDDVFNNHQWRADMLSAMWSMVIAWSNKGCPELCPGNAMQSFENFASVIGSLVMNIGFMSPFAKRESGATGGGDVRGDAIKRLLRELANRVQPDNDVHTNATESYKVPEVLTIAEDMGIADIICYGNNYSKSLGQQLKKFRGREFVDNKGRIFSFGRRQDAAGSNYDVIILSEPEG